ncbi:enoyl-CoA hydratase/isomerase family protein [Actinomadura violacea]|uniref:Enoyl-CoA hydratase/isomerase family protein n=1 Tax=Actinomadura violacea TaxID=2819934 RepID=A0ABS3S3M7_9ACTN|nr:enoyl-CoA hydratase/isomerase family protein [Actinomadura violacea]MBO2463604.1 enoyl-CoA hydratase/isomerase family protein [Actinomadura violacea]
MDERRSRSRLLTRRIGRVLVVRFDNPPHHFLDERMSVELDRLTRRLVRDTSVGAVVFTGQDSAYPHLHVPDVLDAVRLAPGRVPYPVALALLRAGGLLTRSRLVDRIVRATPLRGVLSAPRLYATFRRMNRADKVFIAAINGTAVAMGWVFALACDIRVAADGTYAIGLPESTVGVLAGAGGARRMLDAIGTSRALEILLEGRMLTPRQAAELGLVHHLVPHADLEAQAVAIARRLATRPPRVTREVKRIAYEGHGARRTAAAFREEGAALLTTMTDRRAVHAITAFHRRLTAPAPTTAHALETAWLGTPREPR